MTTLPDYDEKETNKVTKCQELANEQFLAFAHLDNNDKSKYVPY